MSYKEDNRLFIFRMWKPTWKYAQPYGPRVQFILRVSPTDDFEKGPDYLWLKLRLWMLVSIYLAVRLHPVVAAHLKYLGYVLRHKWFVYREGRKLGVGRWQLLVHDLSKFRPDEWFPYVYTFYIKPAKKKEVGYFHDPGKDLAFDTAWLKHQHRNPHHWQHWMLTQDSEPFKFIPMPEKFWREMVADWKGAGLAQGHDDLMPWYTKNRDNIKLHRETRARVETLIGYEHDSVEVVFTATEEEYEQFLERHNLNRYECVRLWGVLDHLLIGERLVSRVTMSGDARQAPALDDKHTEQLLSERHRLYWEKKQRESK